MMDQGFIDKTKRWVETVVIGLNLCPFASKPFREDKIRYLVQATPDRTHLVDKIVLEATLLADEEVTDVETTLIIHPDMLSDFMDYLDFIEYIEEVLVGIGLEGVIQVASFHPEYQFEGTQKGDPENYTNRSPFPMIHLIREASVSRAVDLYPDVEKIPEQNIKTMNELGKAGIQKLLQQL